MPVSRNENEPISRVFRWYADDLSLWTHRCSNVRSRALLQGLGGHVCVPCIPGINFCTGPIVIFRYFFSVFLWLAALFSVVSRLFLFLAIAPSFSLLLDLKLVENFVSHCGFWKNGSVWLLAYHRFLKKKNLSSKLQIHYAFLELKKYSVSQKAKKPSTDHIAWAPNAEHRTSWNHHTANQILHLQALMRNNSEVLHSY